MKKYHIEEHISDMEPHLRQIATSLTDNPDDTRDLIQDTLLSALSQERCFTDLKLLKDWLTAIMRHIFNHQYGRPRKFGFSFVICDDSTAMHVNGQVEGSILAHDVVSAIESLAEDNRVPFDMFLKGYKYVEIAESLGLPLSTVKSRIYNARQRLQQMLEDYS